MLGDQKVRRKIHDNLGLAEGYLLDLIANIKEEALCGIDLYNRTHIKGKDYSKEKISDEGYVCGFAHGYSRIISLMLQKAKDYDIPLSDLGLDGIDRDKDLLPGM